VSAELPPALQAALARELEGVSRKALAERARRTSEAYRQGRGSSGVIRDREDALAYALTRLPATYAACAAVFAEARARAPHFAPASLLDAGSGTGAASWAAAEAWPSLVRLDWLDENPTFLDLAQRLATGALPPIGPRRGDLAAEHSSAELVVASYALAEIAPARQAEVVQRLWAATERLLALVEPGTPAGFERLRAAREALIGASAQILAPCPHHLACPIAAPDWCHFAIRLPRSRDHLVTKEAQVPFEDEPYAYLLAAHPGLGAPATARVLSPPRATKPGIDLKLCTPSGLERRTAPRREKAAYAQARRLRWGDAAE
jgi:ribosomal protein RSM22 (predicted rRNA methylase)